MLIPARRRFAIAWGSAPISFPRAGASGCSALALARYFTSAAAQMLGDVALATANSKLSVQMATEHDLAQPRAWSMGVAGWCAAENGGLEEGLALATQAIAAMQAIHSRHFL